MPTWSDNLKIELLDVGASNWGNLTNNNFKWAIEESITGYATVTFPLDSDYDWSAGYTNSNSSQAQRNLVLNVVGTLSQTRELIVPTIEKQYIVQNNTTGSQAITVKTAAGTGVTVPNGRKMHVYVDGTNVIQMSDYDVTRTIGTLSLTNALSVANGGTGATTSTGSGAVVLATSPTLVTPALGTPSAVVLTNATGLPLATGVTGTLAVSNGGTGLTSYAVGDLLYATGSTTLAKLNIGATGQVLQAGATTPEWGGLSGNVTTIQLANSSTPGAVPSALSLSAGELVVNTADGKLYFKNSSGTVQVLAQINQLVTGGALGTPSSGTLTNCTDLPVSTGISGLGTGVATFLATPSSANLAAAVTGETGTGALVFATSPTLVTPTLGVATATSINGVIINRGLNNNSDSVALGPTALDSTTSGNFNVAIGSNTGTAVTSGTNNSLYGRGAGQNITTGSQNVAIGREAAKDLTTGSECIYIGRESQASASNVTKEIVIAISKTGLGSDTTFIGGSNGVYNENDTTTWDQVSDERIKRDIVDADGGLSVIDAVRVRNYRYKTAAEMPLDENGRPLAQNKDPDTLRIGFIAQELEQVLPESVTVQSNGVRSVNIDALHYHLILAVQQLSAQVKALQSQLK